MDFFYKHNIKIYQVLVIIYKRALAFYSQHENKRGLLSLLKCGFRSLFSIIKLKIIFVKNSKIEQIKNLLDVMSINYDGNGRFYYWIDESIYYNDRYSVIGNMPLDYSLVIDNSICDIKNYVGLQNNGSKYTELLDLIEKYIDRISDELSGQEKTEEIIANLQSMKTNKAKDLTDALQRILFWNALLHQTGQKLVGLGRLDYILDRFDTDSSCDKHEILKEFCMQLHRFYEFKSQALLGDTGQLIILGGKTVDGEWFSNSFTYEFIDIIRELKLPDPKLLLRVSNKTDRNTISRALECAKTGNGSPLFSNDDVIIPLLIEFGFDKDDAYNYGVSACWEPVIIGKSMDQNNLITIPYAKIFINMINSKEVLDASSIDDVYGIYINELTKYISDKFNKIVDITWEEDPIVSLFFNDCISSGKDISKGGAKYNNYGILSDGLSNAVNSLINLEQMVFVNKTMNILQVRSMLKRNFKGNNELRSMLENSEEFFGRDDNKVIEISNMIFEAAKNVLSEARNSFGGKFKIGLSSPNYLYDGARTGATFDGRLQDKPLSTHISCDKNLAYTELVSFASKLDYSGCGINGNVVDFMVTPDFINNNFEKFIDFIILSISQGFYQMQMNVISSDILIDAKNHPENYKQLIVRVWGFSAFYVDLPEKYKDMLIERALKNEGKAA